MNDHGVSRAKMAGADFRRQQAEHRFDEHVRPINEMVDELRHDEGGLWMPYVAPVHGGIHAGVLSVLRDAGPKTQDGTGSGFLCIENADPSAEAQRMGFAEVGLGASDITPWNAYPWYINRAPKAAELEQGVDPLVRLLRMMPKVRVVLLQGGEAKDTWRRALKRYPELDAAPLTVIATYHPSRKALWVKDPAVRAARLAHRHSAYAAVASALRA